MMSDNIWRKNVVVWRCGWRDLGIHWNFFLLCCILAKIAPFVCAVIEAYVGCFRSWGGYWIKFLMDPQQRGVGFGFLEGKQFVCLPIVHCGRADYVAKSYVDLTFGVLSAVSGDANLIRCDGVNADFVQALEWSSCQKAGSQSPLSLITVLLERLLHRRIFSEMGKINKFSMLLLLRLNGLLDERWVQPTQHFRKVELVIVELFFSGSIHSSLETFYRFRKMRDWIFLWLSLYCRSCYLLRSRFFCISAPLGSLRNPNLLKDQFVCSFLCFRVVIDHP